MPDPVFLDGEAARAAIRRVFLRELGSEEDFMERAELLGLLNALVLFHTPRAPGRQYWFQAARFLRRRLGRPATKSVLQLASPGTSGKWRLRVTERSSNDHADPNRERRIKMSERDAAIGKAVLHHMKAGISIKRACALVSQNFEWNRHGITKLQPSGVETSFKRHRAEIQEMADITGDVPDPDFWRQAGRPSTGRFAKRK